MDEVEGFSLFLVRMPTPWLELGALCGQVYFLASLWDLPGHFSQYFKIGNDDEIMA